MAEVTVTLPAQLALALKASRETKIKASNLRELIKALSERYGEAFTYRIIDREGKLNPNNKHLHKRKKHKIHRQPRNTS